MSKPILYHMDLSPPSRFAVMTAQHIGLDIEIRRIDLWKGDSLTPEYIAINPTKTVPALVDGDLNVFDSSAISIHLVEKYAKDDSLYPKDLNLRAKILVPMYIRGATEANQVQLDEMLRGYGEIESFLNGRDYLASNTLTLPDL